MAEHPTLELRDGRSIPQLGFGVFQVPPGEQTKRAVEAALAAGYRHVDTAAVYRNEAEVGAAIRASGLAPGSVWVTTKLANADQGAATVRRAFEASLGRLGVDAVDLYLLHWPHELRLERRVELDDRVAGPVAVVADHDAVGLQEVLDRGALLEELGAGDVAEALLALLAEGALDVYYTSIQMKKNRPGTLLTVLGAPEARERLTAIVFQETTTIGVRHRDVARECLDRETVTVQTPFGAVRIKIARRNGAVMNASPEFDDCVRLAGSSGRPLKDIQAAAVKSYLERQ